MTNSNSFWVDAFKWHNEAAAESGRVAARILVLINGGAAVALLGLIGALAGAECFEDQQTQRFGSNLIWFAWGVVFATATLCLVYLVNYCHAGAARTQIAKPGAHSATGYGLHMHFRLAPFLLAFCLSSPFCLECSRFATRSTF